MEDWFEVLEAGDEPRAKELFRQEYIQEGKPELAEGQRFEDGWEQMMRFYGRGDREAPAQQ